MKYPVLLKPVKLICIPILFITGQTFAQPAISSFAPVAGTVGSTVIISGTGFNAVPANNIVYFGAVRAGVTAGSTTSLSVTVPSGATYHPISVLNVSTGLAAYSAKPFSITFPSLVIGNLPGNFYKPKVDFITATNPAAVAIADIDIDGKPDIVVVNTNSNTVSVFRNTASLGIISAATFATKVDFATGNFSKHVVIGDMDGDGKPDLVIVNSNNVSVLRNTSTPGAVNAGTFAAIVNFDLVFTGPVTAAIADFDGDGKPDMVAANSAANSVSVLRNTSTPGVITAAPKVDFAAGSSPSFVSITDVDGDNKPDMIVSNANVGGNTVSILQNTSTTGIINAASFSARVTYTTGPIPRAISVGDVDGDGKSDLVVANSEAVSTTISALRNTAAGGAINAGSFAAKVDFTTGISPYAVALSDIDGDGKPDFLAANSNSNTVSVLRNTSVAGTITANSKVDFTTGLQPRSVASGDLDGDGIPEIVSANFSGNTVSVLQVDLSSVPVKMTSVKAYQKNNGVHVDWSVEQEINILGYDVERSHNGQHFTQLQTVAAIGSSGTTEYRVHDANPFRGLNFYRVKIIETGKIRYSQVVKVNNNGGLKTGMTIYPNPIINNNISLQTSLPEGKYLFILLNNQGQAVVTRSITHGGGSATENFEIDRKIPAGVYRVKLVGQTINLSSTLIIN